MSELSSAFTMATPSRLLPRATVPAALGQIKLAVCVFCWVYWGRRAPCVLVGEIGSLWGGQKNALFVGSFPPVAPPPIRFLAELLVTRMPLPALPRSIVPLTSVP